MYVLVRCVHEFLGGRRRLKAWILKAFSAGCMLLESELPFKLGLEQVIYLAM
jgi:hypothetical protein